jgi:ribosomal-protein-alanine N-acetyltransferase
MVVERESRIIGYMVYVLFKKRICLLKMAVHTNYRRFGVGTKMINKIVKKLSSYRRKGIIIDVRESNLEAQIFLRSLSFKALCVKRNFYSDNGEDSYFFEYKLLDEINPNGVQ